MLLHGCEAFPQNVDAARLFEFSATEDLDSDLFDLFLHSGIFRTYADRYLDPAQREDVDIRDFQLQSIRT